MDEQNLILRISNISPSARNQIDNEEYILNCETDDLTMKFIIQNLMQALVEDLLEIGIEFTCTIDDLCENGQSMEYLVRLGELVMPSELYETLKKSREIRNTFESILRGDISDNDIIITILQYFGYINDLYRETYEPVADFFLDKATNSTTFDIYLTNLIHVDSKITDLVENDAKKLSAYVVYATNLIQSMYNRLDELQDKISSGITDDDDEDEDKIPISEIASRLIHKASHNFMNVESLNRYAWIFMMPKETNLSELELALKNKYTKEIHTAFPFYMEYFTSRNITPTDADLLCILIYTSVTASSVDEYGRLTMDMDHVPADLVPWYARTADLVEREMNHVHK